MSTKSEGLRARIREALRARRVTQAELAREVGVSRQLVTFWLHKDEAKQRPIDSGYLPAIARALAVSEAWLEGTSGVGGPAPGLTGEVAEVASRYALGAGSRLAREREIDRELGFHLRKEAPYLVDNLNRRMQHPSTGTNLALDYVSRSLVMDVATPRLPQGITILRAKLWQLALFQQVDAKLGMRRDYVLALMYPRYDQDRKSASMGGFVRMLETVSREAEAMGIRFQVFNDAEGLAGFILSHEHAREGKQNHLF